MAYTTQTTQQISDTIVSGLEASFGQTIPVLPKAFARVLSKALAGSFALLWRYAGWMFLQMFVQYASDDEVTIGTRTFRPLSTWGALLGAGVREEATRAELVIAVTVTNQTGSLAAGSKLIRASTGVIYSVIEKVSLSAATVQASVRAVSDQDGNGGAGSIGNLVAGDTISFLSPTPNVAREASVVSVTTSGEDAESVEDYRVRILNHKANPPQGGAYADYRLWALDVSGINHVYPYTAANPGEVDVYCEATEASSGSADGIPTAGQLTAVAAAIELDDDGLASRRPAGVEIVNVYAITRTEFEVEVSGLSPSTSEVQTGIEDALEEHFLDREPFILGISSQLRKDRISEGEVSGIVSSVAAAHGSTITSIELTQSGSPVTIYTLGEGEKAKVSVSFV